MIGFVLRKSLYDFWDNLFKIVLINLGFILVITITVYLPYLASRLIEFMPLQYILYAVGMFGCSTYLATVSYSMKSISDYGSFGFTDFIKNIKHAWPAGLAMGIFTFVIFLVVTVILPFYFGMESPVGVVLTAVVLWVTLFFLISFQFYFSVYARLGGKVFKSIRKCLIISLDNTGFSIFIFIHNLIVIILPFMATFLLFLIILFPGPAGIFLYIDEALRLRLLKYDWLEANPGENRRKIPWDALLIEEREKTGVRSFRNFIFPWKD